MIRSRPFIGQPPHPYPPGYSWGFPGIFPEFSQSFPGVFPGFSQGFQRILLLFSQGFPGFCWSFSRVFRGLPGVFRVFSQSFSSFFLFFLKEKSNNFFKKIYIYLATSPKLYRSYYPHRLRHSLSPVCGIFLLVFNVRDILGEDLCALTTNCATNIFSTTTKCIFYFIFYTWQTVWKDWLLSPP